MVVRREGKEGASGEGEMEWRKVNWIGGFSFRKFYTILGIVDRWKELFLVGIKFKAFAFPP